MDTVVSESALPAGPLRIGHLSVGAAAAESDSPLLPNVLAHVKAGRPAFQDTQLKVGFARWGLLPLNKVFGFFFEGWGS